MSSGAASDRVVRTVAVIGGGVAGIAAAVRAAESGWRVILLESSGRLGGRAGSFDDVRSGLELDVGQHVVLGCCTNILELYDRLGVLDQLDWQNTLWFARGAGAFDALSITPWIPAPLHALPSFARMRLLRLGEKWSISRALLAILRLGPKGRVAWQGRPFGEFLSQHRQSARAVECFWDPIVLSACNLSCARCEATHALKVVDEGLLAHPFAGALGVSRVPLSQLYGATESIITQAGGEVRFGTTAKALAFDGARITGVVCDDGVIPVQAVITALPPDRLARLCSDTLRAKDKRLANLERFLFSPILGVHLAFRRRVMTTPNLALPTRLTHWLFSHDAPTNDGCVQRVSAVVSSAEAWIGLSESAITERVLADLRWAIPECRNEDLLWSRPILERHATFAGVPGIESIRPRARTEAGDLRGGVENLFLGGEWTDTGWPSTMEGAARSGFAAATACTNSTSGVAADLPPATLVRWARLLSN